MVKNLQQDKRVTFDRDALFNLDNSNIEVKLLTLRDVAFFASIANVMLWRTRWLNVSSNAQFDDAQAYASDAIERLFMTVDFCQQVADCITNDEATQNAIESLVSQNQIGAPGEPPTDVNAPINSSAYNPSCDQDILWAQCLQLVQRIDNALRAVFAQLEVASNAAELVDVFLSLIPGGAAIYKSIGAAGVVQGINYLQEAIQEQYEAQATITYLEDLACDLFCECQSDCEITPQRFFDVMSTRTSAYITNPISTLQDAFQTIAGLGLTTSIVADATFWLSAATLQVGSILFPAEVGYGIDVLMRLAVDDASADWQILCTSCANTTCYLGTNGYNGATITIAAPSFGSAIGSVVPAEATGAAATTTVVVQALKIVLPASVTPTAIRVTLQGNMAQPENGHNLLRGVAGDGSTIPFSSWTLIATRDNSGSIDGTYIWNNPSAGDEFWIFSSVKGTTSTLKITEVCIVE